MKINDILTEAGFSAWKNNRNLNAPAAASPSSAAKVSGAAPATPGNLADLAKMGKKPAPSASDTVDDILDQFKGSLYRFTGMGGEQGNMAATRTKFISDFAQQYKLAQRSARQGGIEFNAPEYVQAYLRRYNWQASPEQLAKIENITDPNQLANAVYAIGIQQSRDKYGQVDTRASKQPVTKSSGTVDNPVLTKPSQQILSTMKNMKGEDYKDDLESIVRLALNNLYATDPGDYGQEVKRIMGQKPAQNAQNPQV